MRQDGKQEYIRPSQIAETQNPVADLNTLRPDFQGALYQFLIGLLQTSFAPKDEGEWLGLWKKAPTAKELQEVFGGFETAFVMCEEKEEEPAFMQDLELNSEKSKEVSIRELLIDAPGKETLKKNTDHFVKRNTVTHLCLPCTATALYTLQTNAPSGGQGHRTGLRGGGPLTTLILPPLQMQKDTLWQRLWLNILPKEEVLEEDDPAEGLEAPHSSIFPWLAPTRTSEKNTTITPEDVSHLQAYWGMPRRIRINSSAIEEGKCSLCSREGKTIKKYQYKNYGTNYEGPWTHPLTPYRYDSKTNKPLSVKGQKSGLGYRDWLSLTYGQDEEKNNSKAAKIVRYFNEERSDNIPMQALLWCFGFDMDNMKVRCWHEAQMPLLQIPTERQVSFVQSVGLMLRAAKEANGILGKAVKKTMEGKNKIKGTETFWQTVEGMFWQATELDFYECLERLGNRLQKEDFQQLPADIAKEWWTILRGKTEKLFDKWTLEANPEDLDLKRITRARRSLLASLGKKTKYKEIGNLIRIAEAEKEKNQGKA